MEHDVFLKAEIDNLVFLIKRLADKYNDESYEVKETLNKYKELFENV